MGGGDRRNKERKKGKRRRTGRGVSKKNRAAEKPQHGWTPLLGIPPAGLSRLAAPGSGVACGIRDGGEKGGRGGMRSEQPIATARNSCGYGRTSRVRRRDGRSVVGMAVEKGSEKKKNLGGTETRRRHGRRPRLKHLLIKRTRSSAIRRC